MVSSRIVGDLSARGSELNKNLTANGGGRYRQSDGGILVARRGLTLDW
jgi:hypothetical protein